MAEHKHSPAQASQPKVGHEHDASKEQASSVQSQEALALEAMKQELEKVKAENEAQAKELEAEKQRSVDLQKAQKEEVLSFIENGIAPTGASRPKRAIQPDQDEDGNVFGNKDGKKEYPFSPGWLEMVVVRQSRIETLASGTKVEDPSSIRVMPYEPATFKNLQKNEGFGDLKVIVLHQP